MILIDKFFREEKKERRLEKKYACVSVRVFSELCQNLRIECRLASRSIGQKCSIKQLTRQLVSQSNASPEDS